jgi:hypothetical protein
MLAARPSAAGARRSPFCSTTAPRVTSSPAAADVLAGRAGTALKRTRPSAVVQGLAVFLHHHRVGAGRHRRAGEDARHVPGASGPPALPAAMRWDTGSSTPGRATSAARTA